MSRAVLIYNADVVNRGAVTRGYVLTSGPVIAATGAGAVPPDIDARADERFDARGALLMPGCIDDHVHFREPGLTAKADIATESRAAVAGGVTSVMDMPNTIPPTVTLDAVEAKLAIAEATSAANYACFLGATSSNLEVLLRADYTSIPGVKLFLGSSTGNMLVDGPSALDAIFAEVPALITVHAEDETIIRRNRALVEQRYPGGDAPVALHSRIRSSEACVRSTEAAMERAARYGSRLHVMHVSTLDELSLMDRGPVEGKRVTCEVSPHHLWWTLDDYSRLGTRIKMNPAVKNAADREGLRLGVKEGLVDLIATDHAPHLPADKAGGCLKAASGAPAVQFSLVTSLELFDPATVALRMAHAPAALYGLADRGYLEPGRKADMVLVERLDSPAVIVDSMVLSRCGWTPWAGAEVSHSVAATWVNGHRVYTRGEGVDTDAPRHSELLHFSR